MYLRLEDNSGWNSVLIKEICKEDSVEAILNQKWPYTTNDDQLYWCGSKLVDFTVSNCYDINTHNSVLDHAIWKSLWKSQMHERLKLFLWRVLSDVIPTKEVLSKRFDE